MTLRFSDLFKLTLVGVLNENKKSFKFIIIIEGRTKKKIDVELNKTSQKALWELLEQSMHDNLFKFR